MFFVLVNDEKSSPDIIYLLFGRKAVLKKMLLILSPLGEFFYSVGIVEILELFKYKKFCRKYN